MSAFSRKPSREPEIPVVDEALVAEVINKGGRVKSDPTPEPIPEPEPELAPLNPPPLRRHMVNLRLDAETLSLVNQAVARRRPRIDRHLWILEAIQAKLEQETPAAT